jgi:peptidoglycan/xylan/chitin deacetylase (PgdA/CDA1 family)
MHHSRREFLKAAGATAVSLALPLPVSANAPKPKRHIVTLSFDDGFKKSCIKTAEIYEKHKLSACLNIVASAHMQDFRPPDYPDVPRGDFGLWNELKARGHEIMPHGYRHANKRSLDDEGWGPMTATYLERLWERLLAVETVDILPAGKALAKYANAG